MPKLQSLLFFLCVQSLLAQERDWGAPWPGPETEVMVVQAKPVVIEGTGVEAKVEGNHLYVKAPLGQPARIRLAKIVGPQISQPRYVVKGSMLYSEVGGEGYLEMWSDFGNDRRFFTRTLATHGPMAYIVGDSGLNLRSFLLPFNTDGKLMAPRELEINLVLPQGGNFYLSPSRLTLLEYALPPKTENETQPAGAVSFWPWSASLAMPVLAAILLVLRAPRSARFLAWAGVAAGGVLLLTGMVAPFFGRSTAGCYPLLVAGVLTAVLSCVLLWFAVRLRQKDELRRMVAMDLS